MKDSKELLLAADYCSHDDAKKLREILEKSSFNPNELLSSFKYKFTRTNVPLLCICVISNSIDCAKLLISAGANIEITDGNFILFFHTEFFLIFYLCETSLLGLLV